VAHAQLALLDRVELLARRGLEHECLADAERLAVDLERALALLLDPEVVADREDLFAHRVKRPLRTAIAEKSHGSSLRLRSRLSRKRRRDELRLGLLAEGCSSRDRAPAGTSAAQDEERRPHAPERGQGPVPEQLQHAPRAEQHQVSVAVPVEADLLDQERAGGLQLP